MAIRRYLANADNTITNAFEYNLTTRGTGSNMGASDVSEVFTIYGQASSSSLEIARIITQFPVSSITNDRTAGTIPASGSVNFVLRMFNATHGETLPRNFSLNVSAISGAWEEGTGLDMEGYTDLSYDGTGSNWIRASKSDNWVSTGGDFYSDTSSSFSASFTSGVEDLEVDITTLVEQWLNSSGNVLGSKNNNGVIIMFPSGEQGQARSYYTKRFFARETEFFFKRPVIEARWDSSKKDNAGSFYLESNLASSADNLNRIYLYNRVRGQLKNIPTVGTGDILVSVYSGTLSPAGSKISLPLGGGVTTLNHTNITGAHVSTGIYSASFAYGNSSVTKIFPVWFTGSEAAPTVYHTASGIDVKTFEADDYNPSPNYVTTVTNLKKSYTREEEARIRLYVRQKDFSPTIYTKANADPENLIIEDAYFRIIRSIDDLDVVEYGTGSLNHTRLSYDVSGNYFDLPMELLEDGYMYGIKFLYKLPNGLYKEQPNTFKFRVE